MAINLCISWWFENMFINMCKINISIGKFSSNECGIKVNLVNNEG